MNPTHSNHSTSDQPVRIYLIGAGVIAQHHAAGALAKLDRPVDLKVTDPNPAALEAFQQKFPTAKAYSDATQLLAEPAKEADIVIVATPPVFHHPLALQALNTGRHVLCEKPLAMDAKQAHEMLKVAKKHGRLIGCCSVRFAGKAITARIRHMVESQELGKVYHATFVHRFNRRRSGIEYQPTSPWFYNPKIAGGGILMNWCPYDIDCLCEIFKPVRVDVLGAWIATPQTESWPEGSIAVEHHASARLVFHRADGSTVPITFERTECTHGAERSIVEIEGLKGAVRWDWLDWLGKKLTHSFDVQDKLQIKEEEYEDGTGLSPHEKPVVFFYRKIMGQDSPALVNEQAIFQFSVLRAIYDSAATGQTQTVKL